MREITTHKINEGDRQPLVFACGNVGVGGAEQNYKVLYFSRGYNRLCRADSNNPNPRDMHPECMSVDFLSLEEDGVSNEALLAIVIDRLEGFQEGKFACDANQEALEGCRHALKILHDRTLNRMARGVEGMAKK